MPFQKREFHIICSLQASSEMEGSDSSGSYLGTILMDLPKVYGCL